MLSGLTLPGLARTVLLSWSDILWQNAVADAAPVDQQARVAPAFAQLAAQPADGLLDAVRIDFYGAWRGEQASQCLGAVEVIGSIQERGE